MAVAIRAFPSKNHNKCVVYVVAVGPLLMRCRYICIYKFPLVDNSHRHRTSTRRGEGTNLVLPTPHFHTHLPNHQHGFSTKIMSSSTNHKQDPLITLQGEALVRARNVAEKGSLTSDQLAKINPWRFKCIIFISEKKPRSSYSVAAAATGALLENPHGSTPAGPSDGSEKIGVTKGPSADSEWGDNVILL